MTTSPNDPSSEVESSPRPASPARRDCDAAGKRIIGLRGGLAWRTIGRRKAVRRWMHRKEGFPHIREDRMTALVASVSVLTITGSLLIAAMPAAGQQPIGVPGATEQPAGPSQTAPAPAPSAPRPPAPPPQAGERPVGGPPNPDIAAKIRGVPQPPFPATAEKLPLPQLKLPRGFNIEVVASGIADARSLRVGDKGTIFVSNRNRDKVYALVDNDGKRCAKVIASGLDRPNG